MTALEARQMSKACNFVLEYNLGAHVEAIDKDINKNARVGKTKVCIVGLTYDQCSYLSLIYQLWGYSVSFANGGNAYELTISW